MKKRSIKLNFKVLNNIFDINYTINILKTLDIFFYYRSFLPELILLMLVLFIIIFDKIINIPLPFYLAFYL
jgi:hypothetical protein